MRNISGTTVILRLEGLALAILCLWLYGGIFHQSWLYFALLILVPDISMLGYLAGPKVGAALYNAAHSWVLFVALVFLAFYPGKGDPFLMGLVLILGAHIGIDRLLGFGLKHRTGFKDTHLGTLGRAPT